jgi:hypothetical protein
MSINFSDFDRALATVEKQLDDVTIETLQKVVLAADSTIVLATPVDTGRARGNWLPSIGTPREEALLDKFDPSGQNAIAEAVALVSSVKPGDTVYISNNLEYIQALNEGHSQQAPAGFVEKAVQAVKVV